MDGEIHFHKWKTTHDGKCLIYTCENCNHSVEAGTDLYVGPVVFYRPASFITAVAKWLFPGYKKVRQNS